MVIRLMPYDWMTNTPPSLDAAVKAFACNEMLRLGIDKITILLLRQRTNGGWNISFPEHDILQSYAAQVRIADASNVKVHYPSIIEWSPASLNIIAHGGQSLQNYPIPKLVTGKNGLGRPVVRDRNTEYYTDQFLVEKILSVPNIPIII